MLRTAGVADARSSAEPVLVGRRDEVAAIRERIVAASSGSRQAVVITGEAGIGKTRLLAEAHRIATGLGFEVLSASGSEIERARAFGVLTEGFTDLGSEHSGAPHERLLAVIDHVVGRIEEAPRPIAMVVDDMQWADAESMQVLRAVARRPELPFLVIAAARTEVANPEWDALVEAVDRAGGLRVRLHGLGEPDVALLVEHVVEGDVSEQLQESVSSAHGNPFFVLELIAGSSAGDRMHSDLRRTILGRLGHLSSDAIDVLRSASLLGRAYAITDLEAVTGRPAIELLPLLQESLRGGVLEERDERLAFRHDLVHEAVYMDIPDALRRRLHQEAGRALAAAGAPARTVARHLALGGTRGDEEAISWLRRAAAEDLVIEPSSAAELLSLSITLLDPADVRTDRFKADCARALALAGRLTDAESVARDVLPRLTDRLLEAELRTALAEALFFQGRIGEASNEIERAAEMSPERLREIRLAQAALTAAASGQIDRADELATPLTDSADPSAASLSSGVSAMVRMLRGEPGAVDLARNAVAAAASDPSGQAHRYGAQSYLGLVLTEADEFADAVRVFNSWMEYDQARGVAWAAPLHHVGLALARYAAGQWDDAVAELETAQRMLEDMGSLLFSPLAHGLLSVIAFHRGDLDRAEAEVAKGESEIAVTGPQVGIEWCIMSRAELLVSHGQLAPAQAIVSGACHFARTAGFRMAFRYIGPLAVRLALASDDREAARVWVEELEAYAQGSSSPTAAAMARRCRGMLDGDPDALLEAVDMLRAGPRPLEFAGACDDAASALGDSDPRTRGLLQEAVRAYEGIGAIGDVRRIAPLLNGETLKRAQKTRPATGWASLSPTERRIAALVAEGLTNPAIAQRAVVSRRTVETHVYHLFQKLGVSSRVELALKVSKELEAQVQ